MNTVTLAAAAAPAWISFASLGVAVASAGVAIWTLLHNRHRNLRQDRERYAEQVSAWFEADLSRDESEIQGKWPRKLVLVNGSSQPLYSVRAWPGSPSYSQYAHIVEVGFVPPHERIEVKEHQLIGAGERRAVSYQFLDGVERGWLREHNGRLRRRSKTQVFRTQSA
ncbi:hypothetical protein [Streptomyces sp. NPDC094149]|uniref:hypothetical protein n=1 Tax=Streptomyces sp. NPDC094149 TaxID=3155079 RepID=UPI00332119BD